jgi:GT2 family glycosyltransferase
VHERAAQTFEESAMVVDTRRPLANGAFDLPARPVVSIVIPTLNEERYIEQLLDSLAAQDYGADALEVLVADGGSTDRTRELVAAYPARFHALRVVENPKRITVGGLNAGMRAASGDCWVIIGAHSKVRSDFVRTSVEAMQRTGAACVGGPIETIGEGTVGKAIAAAMSSPFGVGNAKFRTGGGVGDVDTVAFGLYHRRVWDEVGEFDETVDGADEDSYNARLREAGGRIVMAPEIRSTYYPRRTFRALAKQYREYGAAKGTLLSRGRPLEARHFAPGAMVAGGALLFALGRVSKNARRLLFVLSFAYIAGGLVMARRAAARQAANPWLTLGAMALMHITYGTGFIAGALKERRRLRQ